MRMAQVVFEGVSKTFPRPSGEAVRAVKDLCLTIHDGEIVVLAGPSGCGKSTTLRLLAGLEDPTSGTIAIDGRVVNAIEPRDRDVAMVFQNCALYPHLTVYENLAFPLLLRKRPRDEIERRVRATATTLELTRLLERMPDALSGGERQRVAVGRAMVRQPKVFLYDEPLSNLDAGLRLRMRVELKRLHEQLGTTTLYVTHDQVEAIAMGRRLAVMKDGAIQQAAEPLDVYRRPANLFVAQFIGSPPMNLFPGAIEMGGSGVMFRPAPPPQGDTPAGAPLPVARAHRAALSAYAGRPVVLGLRPEEIVFDGGLARGPDGVRVNARAEAVERLGAETHLHGSIGGIRFTARSGADCPLGPGQTVSVWLDLDRACYFDGASGRAIG